MASGSTSSLRLPQWNANDEFKMSEFNSAFQTIDTALSGRIKAETGSYVGTGAYGSEHSNSITFSGVPVLLCVFPVFSSVGVFPGLGGNGAGFLWIRSADAVSFGQSSDQRINFSPAGKALSWHCATGNSDPVGRQCNTNGLTYRWVALTIES